MRSVTETRTRIIPTVYPMCAVSKRNAQKMGRKVYEPLVCAARGEHIEGDSGGPGLLTRAERLAGERLEVLCDAPHREFLQGLAANPLGPFVLARAKQRPPQEPVGDGPYRTAPVAARVEAWLLGAGGRRQWMAQPGVACERLRVERA